MKRKKVVKKVKVIKQKKNLADRLIEITPSQDFQGGKAYVAVPFKELRGVKLKTQVYIITSDRERIELDDSELIKIERYSERQPFLLPRWQEEDVQEFLGGATAPDLANLFSRIKEQSESYLDFANPSWHKFLALWIIATYFHRQNTSFPYIHLQGNAESGKTKCLLFITTLAFNGELSVNNTPAYMIRVIHNNHSTCCLDEVEDLNKSKDEDVKTILAMLNAGYKKGSFVGKSEAVGNNWIPKRFEGYSPKVFAGISNIYHTLASRSINIVMVRSLNKDVVNRELDENNPALLSIRNGLYRAMLTHHKALAKSYAAIQDAELLGRSWEIWKPILALAVLVDRNLYTEMRALGIKSEINKRDVQTEGFIAPILLKSLHELLLKSGFDNAFFTTTELYRELILSDEENFGWLAKEENKTIRGKWLGNELRRSGIVTGKALQKKSGGITSKGYMLEGALIIERLKSFGVAIEPATEEEQVEDGAVL